MRYFFILLSFLTVRAAIGQSKRLDPQSDTAFWFALKQQDAARIGLRDLTLVKDSLHIRYWMENQAIDVWTIDGEHFGGVASNHTEAIDQDNALDGKYYSNKINLTSAEATKVFELFHRAGIFSWASDQKINGWVQGSDGAEYLFECATPSLYSFKAYWTPSAQEHVKEADTLARLNEKLTTLLQLKEKWMDFLATLPTGCYREGEMMMVCTPAKNRRKVTRR